MNYGIRATRGFHSSEKQCTCISSVRNGRKSLLALRQWVLSFPHALRYRLQPPLLASGTERVEAVSATESEPAAWLPFYSRTTRTLKSGLIRAAQHGTPPA